MARDTTAQVAYPPWTTFNSALNKLHDKGLPEKLDRTVFDGQSGSTQAILMASMRAVGGIDDEGNVQPLLHRLVDPAQRKAALKEIIESKYGAVMALGPTATQGQFDQAFSDYGVAGATRRKAQAFFLSAANEVGIKLSKHIAGATKETKTNGSKPAGGTNRPQRKNRGRGTKGGTGDGTGESTLPRDQEPSLLFHPAVDSFLREARKLTEGATWTKDARDRVIQGFTTQLDLFLPVKPATRARPAKEASEVKDAGDEGSDES
jgi:hypothetical protein